MNRKRLRFSVKAMLVLVSLAGVPLSMLANDAHRQNEVRMSLKAANATVGYTSRFGTQVEATQNPALSVDLFFGIEAVGITIGETPTQTTRLLAQLSSLRRLRSLHVIASGQFTDKMAEKVGDLNQITELVIVDCGEMTDYGARHLGKLKSLVRLHITEAPRLTSTAMRHLGKLPHLRLLSLPGHCLESDAVSEICSMHSLEQLSLGSNQSKIDDRCIPGIREFKSLKELDLQGASLSPSGLRVIIDQRFPRFVYGGYIYLEGKKQSLAPRSVVAARAKWIKPNKRE